MLVHKITVILNYWIMHIIYFSCMLFSHKFLLTKVDKTSSLTIPPEQQSLLFFALTSSIYWANKEIPKLKTKSYFKYKLAFWLIGKYAKLTCCFCSQMGTHGWKEIADPACVTKLLGRLHRKNCSRRITSHFAAL